jgi:hypothetical protein
VRRLPAFLALVIAIGAAPAFARAVTGEETAALAARIAAFDAAVRANDYGAIITVIPPPMLQHIADEAKIPLDQLTPALAGQMEQVLASVTLVSFGMALDDAEHRELGDGTPYLLIPTETVMEAEGMGRMKVSSFTLGMLDAGEWYLVRTSDAAMVGVLRHVYPQFNGVAFPADTTTSVEE